MQRDTGVTLLLTGGSEASAFVLAKGDHAVDLTEEVKDFTLGLSDRGEYMLTVVLPVRPSIEIPIEGIELQAADFGGVSREEVEAAFFTDDFTTSPVDRIMQLLQSRGLAGVPSGDASSGD